eukprot:gb/GEZN01006696.1/.p1 GENE.gb/GEZN01006696.1/~~gb/GEZN01006696.1/.p1  ORF type:complete len:496 (-),score=50.90 gb/GEZN01006696.1/:141-1598(-)
MAATVRRLSTTSRAMQAAGPVLSRFVVGGSLFGPVVGSTSRDVIKQTELYLQSGGRTVEFFLEKERDLIDCVHPFSMKNPDVSFMGSLMLTTTDQEKQAKNRKRPANLLCLAELSKTASAVETAVGKLLDSLNLTGELDVLVLRGIDMLKSRLTKSQFEAQMIAVCAGLEYAVKNKSILSYGVYSQAVGLPPSHSQHISLAALHNMATQAAQQGKCHFQLIGCPLNLTDDGVLQAATLGFAKEKGMRVLGLDILDGREPSAGTPLSLMSYRPYKEGTEKDETKKLGKLLNNAIALECLYPDMVKRERMTSLPESAKLSWTQVIVANQAVVENPYAWQYIKELTILPSVKEALQVLTQVPTFSSWAMEYSSALQEVLQEMEKSIHHTASFRASALCTFLDEIAPALTAYPTLEGKALMTALSCDYVDAIVSTRVDLLPLDSLTSASQELPLSPTEAKRVIAQCRQWLTDHPPALPSLPSSTKIMQR